MTNGVICQYDRHNQRSPLPKWRDCNDLSQTRKRGRGPAARGRTFPPKTREWSGRRGKQIPRCAAPCASKFAAVRRPRSSLYERLGAGILDVEAVRRYGLDSPRPHSAARLSLTCYSAMRSMLGKGMLNLPEMYSLSSSFEWKCFS